MDTQFSKNSSVVIIPFDSQKGAFELSNKEAVEKLEKNFDFEDWLVNINAIISKER